MKKTFTFAALMAVLSLGGFTRMFADTRVDIENYNGTRILEIETDPDDDDHDVVIVREIGDRVWIDIIRFDLDNAPPAFEPGRATGFDGTTDDYVDELRDLPNKIGYRSETRRLRDFDRVTIDTFGGSDQVYWFQSGPPGGTPATFGRLTVDTGRGDDYVFGNSNGDYTICYLGDGDDEATIWAKRQ